MAISSATIKKMRDSASSSNNSKASSSTSSSGGNSSSSSSGGTGYKIGSSAGMSIADNMRVGEVYSASDGSTWKKESDGSVTVTHNGQTYRNAYTSSQAKINGVDDVTQSKMTSEFNQSSKVTSADKKTDKAYSSLEKLVNTNDIISDDVWDSINSTFEVPSAVTEADAWLSGQLEKIQSGKTSYSDQVKDMMDKIMNREKFSYNVDTDPLFQQALASAMNSGKQAMQDTIGQASALTGGYGSTYATTAGNQAYNAFIEDAYDNLPQYYQMALEAYEMEGEEMYRQYSMLSTEDEKEFNRNLTAYDATYQHRNQIYNEAYTQFRDEKTDAFNTANLQLSEHGQKVSDAYNLYSAASNQADKLYEREYTQWADSVNLAYQYASMLNSDWQNQANRDFQATENQKQRDWQSSEAQKDRDFTASENAKNRAASRSGGGSKSAKTVTYTQPTQAQRDKALQRYNEGGESALDAYIASFRSQGNEEWDSAFASDLYKHAYDYGDSDAISWDNYGSATITRDTHNGYEEDGLFGTKLFSSGQGVDHNDEYTFTDASGNNHTYTYDEMADMIDANTYATDEEKEALKKSLQGMSKN